MGNAPDAVKRLVEARGMTETSDISDRVLSRPCSGHARKVFLSPDYKEEHLPKAKTPHEQESVRRQIAATDWRIDELMYQLYALTEKEIRIVEGGRK